MAWPLAFAYRERDSGARREPLPFQLRFTSSPLRVHVDPAAVLDDLGSAYFDLLDRHSDGTSIERVQIDPSGSRPPGKDVWFVDRAVVGPNSQYGIRRYSDGGQQGRATRFHVDEFARQFADLHDLSIDEALEAQLRYEAAHSADVDLYVTTREPVFGYRMDDSMFSCRPQEALAVVGLFQRLHGSLFVIDGFDHNLSTGLAEFATTLALVPELRGNFPRVGVESELWEPTASLLRSARTRLERVLGDRDRLIARHVLSGRAVPFESAEALLERIALNISGLFDALARAINRALELGVKPRLCSFRSGMLPKLLPAPLTETIKATRLVELLYPVVVLRNTIHQVHLGPGAYSDHSRTLEPLASIPSDDAADFLRSLRPFPQLSRWSVGKPDQYGLHLRPLPLVEDLLPLVIDAFRQIVAATPWPGQLNPTDFWYDRPTLHEQLGRLYGLGSLASH